MVRGARPEVHIVGPGAHGDVLCALAGELRIPMRWTPGVPHGRVPEVLANADIAALPSRHRCMIGHIERDAAGMFGYPRIPGRGEDAFDLRGLRQFPAQGMFASTASHQQDIHARPLFR